MVHVKCLFHHNYLKRRDGANNYEELILLLKATSFYEAIEKAEEEAKEYVVTWMRWSICNSAMPTTFSNLKSQEVQRSTLTSRNQN